MLLGWVTNNYWETNFRPHQPGLVTARYRVLPYAGAFDEAAAHRFGLDAAADQPLLQHLGETTPQTPWPQSGTLLELPAGAVIPLHVKPGADGTIVVRLLNASDEPQQAVIGSGIIQIGGAQMLDLFEQPAGEIAVTDGKVTVSLAPRAVAAVAVRRA